MYRMHISTIGHSTHTIREFIEILKEHKIRKIADVRTIPKSRHNPQFNKEAVSKSLKRAGISYKHMPELGGLRKPKKDSINTAWRNSSFRGFADYMQTEEFEKALMKLLSEAKKKQTAIMCAEAVPWRCHRSLIADALAVKGISVKHIFSLSSIKSHEITKFAKIRNKKVTYPQK